MAVTQATASFLVFVTFAFSQAFKSDPSQKIPLTVPAGVPLGLYLTKRVSKRIGASRGKTPRACVCIRSRGDPCRNSGAWPSQQSSACFKMGANQSHRRRRFHAAARRANRVHFIGAA